MNALPLLRRPWLACLALVLSGPTMSVAAENVPPHAAGLSERLIEVALSADAVQQGVLSVRTGAAAPTHLVLLLPGAPSVVRPVVEGESMVRSSLTGNFLIRARRHLVAQTVATLIVDCRSDQGPECSGAYQSSAQRYLDVARLIEAARQDLPSVTDVWLVGTSLGTISSAFMPIHATAGAFAGTIHTASIVDPRRYRSTLQAMIDFDYRRIPIPQAFVHHVDDPCEATTFRSAQRISEAAGVPLIAVTGAGQRRGDPCQANSEHGFIGIERSVMAEIRKMVLDGVGVSRRLELSVD